MPDLRTFVLPVLPLDGGVVLPHMVVTVTLDRDDAKAAMEASSDSDGLVLLVPRNEGDYASIGTVAKVEDKGTLPSGIEVCVVRGLNRAVIGSGVAGSGPALWVQVESKLDPDIPSERSQELAREYKAILEAILDGRGDPGIKRIVRSISDPGQLADMSGYSPDLSDEDKLEILQTLKVEVRLEKLIEWSKDVLAEQSLKDKIRKDVSEGMEKQQRDFFLRQQMQAIKKELGDSDGDIAQEYRAKVAAAGMPESVLKEAERELDRLERTSEQSPEYGWIRTYLDWMVEIPWSVRSDDQYDIAEARRILDEDHSGLDDVKDRIIEFLAVMKLRDARKIAAPGGRGSGAIITLVGPPGVGKTSLGESVARAMGRKFARVSLGGIHDEAEIRGHRRTYVGAMPGRIVRALKEAGTRNPVIMLDEIDKVGSDWRGDPSSALLEVLDPAQNHSFRDHYLEVDLDLSDVMFIPTANVVETIPGPLLDRMEVVRLDGYSEDEKVDIARDHLLNRQIERNGLDVAEVAITDDAIAAIIADHTREAGVRNLERELGKVLRKVATKIASNEVEPPVEVAAEAIKGYLGRPKFRLEVAERTSVPGVATGLAVTGTGGDVLFVEVSAIDGEKGLTLTGQLGDVMKESAEIALSYVKGHLKDIDEGLISKRFHVHVPAGAVPKDGPSAGVTITTALASLLTGRPVRSTVAMTGEVTLQGKVLPIGGVKQKILAAKRAGILEVILPIRNEPDLDEVPETVRDAMKIHLVSDVSEVLDIALEASPLLAGSLPG
ncbi:MAG: endopeptidase La [Actinomycetota bacterium]|nr:endopeptidase La [Actinomycetota bacterium]